MPTITVDDHGTVLYYEDSGAPPGVKDYTTVVFIHGTNFHSGIFRCILPLATQYGLRVVLVNRRDNPGSTPYTDQEVQVIWGSDHEGHVQWMRGIGLGFLKFLETYVNEQDIPKISEDGKSGGLAVLGWSSGNATLCATLAYASELEESSKIKLEEYMRLAIVYDSPGFAIGVSQTSIRYIPTKDNTPTERVSESFGIKVSQYFTHDLSQGRDGLSNTPDNRLATYLKLSPDESEAVISPGVMFRSEGYWNHIDNSVWEETARRGLLEVNAFPRLGVVVLWCDSTVGVVIESVWDFEETARSRVEKGEKTRSVQVKMIGGGANHFIHWEEPHVFMKALKESL